jgi:hypothetical protein
MHIQQNQVQLENGVGKDSAANLCGMGYDVKVKRPTNRIDEAVQRMRKLELRTTNLTLR